MSDTQKPRKEPTREIARPRAGRFEVRLTRIDGEVDLTSLASAITEALGGLIRATRAYDGIRTCDDPPTREQVRSYQVEWTMAGTLRLEYTPFDRSLDIVIDSPAMSIDQPRMLDLISRRFSAERVRARISGPPSANQIAGEESWAARHPGVPIAAETAEAGP